MNEKSCRKCGVIGVWGREAAEGRGSKMCVWAKNVCVGEKCVWRRAKNVCGEGRKIIFFYCFGMVL